MSAPVVPTPEVDLKANGEVVVVPPIKRGEVSEVLKVEAVLVVAPRPVTVAKVSASEAT